MLRLSRAGLASCLLLTALTQGGLFLLQADEPARPPGTAGSGSAVSPAVRREFDRFLDHHPLLEDQLRLQPQLISDAAFVTRNAELHDFLQTNPTLVSNLRVDPGYYVNRALLRQANAPLPVTEFAPLRDLFQQQPRVELALKIRPELIRDPRFLAMHPELHDVLTGHPSLARVFLPVPPPSHK